MNIQNPEDLGSFVKKSRKQQSLTQIELAALSGVGVRYLQELERGKATVQLGKAMDVMHTLGISITLHTREDEA